MQNNRKLEKIRNTDPGTKYYFLEKDYPLVNRLLRKGMTKGEVQSLLGNPQNSNAKYVWMWSEKYDSKQNHITGDDWQSLSFCRSGFYLVFYDNKLQSEYLIKNAEGEPWECIASSLGISNKDARNLILQD